MSFLAGLGKKSSVLCILLCLNGPQSGQQALRHTASSDTIFIQITMDTPAGVPGVSKNHNFFLQINMLRSCAKIEPKLKKLRKTAKTEKKSDGFSNFLQFRLNLSTTNLHELV